MVRLTRLVITLFASSLRTRLSLQLEIAALRHQLAMYQKEHRRPRVTGADRPLWSIVARFWADSRGVLYFVQPRTVTLWQKRHFRDNWRCLSRTDLGGRPQIEPELR